LTVSELIDEIVDDGVEDALGEMMMVSPSGSLAVTSNWTL